MSMPLAWRVDQDAHKGRLLRANALIPKGTTVLIEQPFAQVVFHRHKRHFCARCLAKADPDLCCDDCGQVVFCSEECMERMQPVHAKECEALEEVELIAKKTGIDLDLLRLLVRGLCTRAMEQETENLERRELQEHDGVFVNPRGETVCDYHKVSQMCHALKQLDDSWKTSVRKAIGLVMELLPEECLQDGWEDDALAMAARVNENSYSLDAWREQQVVACVGLFPICGLMNHSCRSNCSWFNDGTGNMQVCALRDIQPDEEITLCYIDVCKPRCERRQELLSTKHFRCDCERCAEPFRESVDRFLECVQCPQCQDGLLYCEQRLDALDEKDQTECDACGHTVPSKQIAMTNAIGRDKLSQARKQLDNRNYEQAIGLLKPLVTDTQTIVDTLRLGAGNATRIASLKALVEAFAKNSATNTVEIHECRESLLQDTLRVFPNNHLQVAWALYHKAESLYTLLLLTPNASNESQRQQVQPLFQSKDALWHEMVESYTKSQEAFGFWLPVQHALRQEIEQKLVTIARHQDPK